MIAEMFHFETKLSRGANAPSLAAAARVSRLPGQCQSGCILRDQEAQTPQLPRSELARN